MRILVDDKGLSLDEFLYSLEDRVTKLENRNMDCNPDFSMMDNWQTCDKVNPKQDLQDALLKARKTGYEPLPDKKNSDTYITVEDLIKKLNTYHPKSKVFLAKSDSDVITLCKKVTERMVTKKDNPILSGYQIESDNYHEVIIVIK